MKKQASQKAFTIVETLVAISILLIALTGPLTIISQSLHSSYFSRDQVTASYLAQEAIEYIRNRRDTNALVTGNDYTHWLDGIATNINPDDSGGDIYINNNGSLTPKKLELVRGDSGYELQSCGVSGCDVLGYGAIDSLNSGYGSTDQAATPSLFTREIILSRAPDDTSDGIPLREVLVTVNVKWQTGDTPSEVTLKETLDNWQLEKPQS